MVTLITVIEASLNNLRQQITSQFKAKTLRRAEEDNDLELAHQQSESRRLTKQFCHCSRKEQERKNHLYLLILS